MIVFLEFVNLMNICAQVENVEIVMNFIALTVIAEFDNFIYTAAARNNKLARLLKEKNNEILIFEKTTSIRCQHEDDKI